MERNLELSNTSFSRHLNKEIRKTVEARDLSKLLQEQIDQLNQRIRVGLNKFWFIFLIIWKCVSSVLNKNISATQFINGEVKEFCADKSVFVYLFFLKFSWQIYSLQDKASVTYQNMGISLRRLALDTIQCTSIQYSYSIVLSHNITALMPQVYEDLTFACRNVHHGCWSWTVIKG